MAMSMPDLRILRNDLFVDVQRATAFAWRAELVRLDVPVDRKRWTITPQKANAYNYAPFNEIVFTAALLQPPAFDPDQDLALTYGGIGAIIGHELAHGFDDVGRRYDASGRQRDLWTPKDAKSFQVKAHALVALYSACEAAPGLFGNGDLTLGENIADIGGLQLAYAAYHKALSGEPAPVIDGLSGDQRFFLGFAMLRRGHHRTDLFRSDMHNDPTSQMIAELALWRVMWTTGLTFFTKDRPKGNTRACSRYLSASTMRAKLRTPRNSTSSFSNREKILRNPFSLRKRRSISLRFL
jgi:predicted metalloendopeptidase